MANKPPETRQEREKMLYYNEARLAAFDRVKGATILVPRMDAEGNSYKEAVKVPETLQEVTYLAYDNFMELAQRQLEDIDG